MGSGKIVLLIWCLGTNIALICPKTSIAQPQPLNPLAVDRDDPLIPLGYGTRELTSFEKYRIEREIVELDMAARAALKQDNKEQAMKLWYRQLRLARSLGKSSEIKALGNVGETVWSENLSEDVRNIAERLQNIETEIKADKTSIDVYLELLATAYQQVGYLDKAVNVYQQIIATAKHNDHNDNKKELGQLYLALFNYRKATQIYEELVSDNNNQAQHLDRQTLINIYERTQKYENAIVVREQLIKQYSSLGKTKDIPALEIATARNYEALKQTDRAVLAYDRAYEQALETQQLAIANDSLQSISQLYQQQGKLNKAIATYNRLIPIQQQSYNHYGLISTYDALGQIHLKLNKYNLAKQYFQQGLALAKSLNYKVKYFENQAR